MIDKNIGCPLCRGVGKVMAIKATLGIGMESGDSSEWWVLPNRRSESVGDNTPCPYCAGGGRVSPAAYTAYLLTVTTYDWVPVKEIDKLMRSLEDDTDGC